MLTNKEFEYLKLVDYFSSKNIDETYNDMMLAREQYGMSFVDYFNSSMYNYTEKVWALQSEKNDKRETNELELYELVSKKTGLSINDIERKINILNNNPYVKIGILEYAEFDMYKLNSNEINEILKNLNKKNKLLYKIKREFQKIDNLQTDYDNVYSLVNQYHILTKKTLLKSEIEEMKETILTSEPEVLNDEAKTINLVTDMLVCKKLMGFWPFEFFMFEFYNKSLPEIREYISNIDRTVRVNKVNNRIKSEILDNKYLTYKALEEYYDRKIISISDKDDYEYFRDFVKHNAKFVKKTSVGAMGDGIELINIANEKSNKKLFNRLIGEGPFIAEELIYAHKQMKKLNEDSVNTLRMTTYNNGKEIKLLWPWIKIGRKGSFVDNSGAGGLGAAVDLEKGIIISDAMDEYGNKYEKHPDNGLLFKGFELPNWEGALETSYRIAKDFSSKIEGVNYVGWDLTCNTDGKWVVIEGNAFPQFVQQATYGKGFKKEFDYILGNN